MGTALTLIHSLIFWLRPLIVPSEFFIFPYLTSLGLQPYSQIFDHHFPGLFFLPLNFASLGFTSESSFKLLTLLLLIVNSRLVASIAKRLSGREGAATLAIFFYALFQISFSGHFLWIDFFMSPFLLFAYLFFLRRRYLLAGASFAIAFLFKQTVGVLFILLLILNIPLRNKFLLVIPSVFLMLGLCLYFLSMGALTDFAYWNFLFNLFVYPQASRIPPGFSDLMQIGWTYLIILFSSSVIFRRYRGSGRWLILLLIMSHLGLHRFGLEHYQPWIGFYAVVSAVGVLSLSSFFRVLILAFSLISFLLFAPTVPQNTSQVASSQIASTVCCNHSVYVFGSDPNIYVLTQSRPPGNLFAFSVPWISGVVESRLLSALSDNAPEYVIYNPASRVGSISISQSQPRLLEYIMANYRLQMVVYGQHILKRI